MTQNIISYYYNNCYSKNMQHNILSDNIYFHFELTAPILFSIDYICDLYGVFNLCPHHKLKFL